jgi:hypothetical protein
MLPPHPNPFNAATLGLSTLIMCGRRKQPMPYAIAVRQPTWATRMKARDYFCTKRNDKVHKAYVL